MKVLQINKLYHPHIGGVEKHVQDLAESLKDRVDVEVLVAGESLKAGRETVKGVPVSRVPSWGVIRSAPIAPGFWGEIRRSRADIYHLHFPNPAGEAAYLAAGSPGKLVVTYHSDVVRQRLLRRLYAPVIKRLLDRADAVLVSSPNLIDSSPWLRPVSAKCRVIPFGIDTGPFALTDGIANEAAELRRRYGPPLLLFVGRLIYYKGLNYLIEAMKSIDANLLIVGQGPLETELKELAAATGVGSKVHFAGRVDDAQLPAYYHAADIFVLPSIASSEAFGLVQLEAHACGRPVVSTDLPTGVPYANPHGVTGLIVPPADGPALAQAVNELLSDDERRLKLGRRAKVRVETEFSQEAMARAVLEVYDALGPDPPDRVAVGRSKSNLISY
jgi:glycosyltransferase involved in cell wall biosynthesis